MDVRQLKCYCAVAASGSVSAAATLLNTSQSAVSYHLKRLEEELEVRLLERHSRGVVLTPAGEALLEPAEEILAKIEEVRGRLHPFRTGAGPTRLNVGITPTTGRVLGPELLDACSIRDELQIVLHERLAQELVDLLLTGGLDAALSYQTPDSDGLRFIPLYVEDLFLVGPPELVRRSDGDIRFADLLALPLVLDPRSHLTRELVEQTAADQGIPLGCDVEIEPSQLKRELIIRHGKCSVVPFGFLEHEIHSGQLAARRVCEPSITCRMMLFFGDHLPAEIAEFLGGAIGPIVSSKIRTGRLQWEPPSPIVRISEQQRA